MNFDPRDLIESNLTLLSEAAAQSKSEPMVLMTVATWGRGADPELLQALQPYRHGLGYNGSIVAHVPRKIATDWMPAEALEVLNQIVPSDQDGVAVVYSAVSKDWVVERL